MAKFTPSNTVTPELEITNIESDTIVETGGGSKTAGSLTQSARKGSITIDLATNSCNIAGNSTYTITLTNSFCDTDSVVAVSSTSATSVTVNTVTDSGCKLVVNNQGAGASDITANFTINYVIL